MVGRRSLQPPGSRYGMCRGRSGRRLCSAWPVNCVGGRYRYGVVVEPSRVEQLVHTGTMPPGNSSKSGPGIWLAISPINAEMRTSPNMAPQPEGQQIVRAAPAQGRPQLVDHCGLELRQQPAQLLRGRKQIAESHGTQSRSERTGRDQHGASHGQRRLLPPPARAAAGVPPIERLIVPENPDAALMRHVGLPRQPNLTLIVLKDVVKACQGRASSRICADGRLTAISTISPAARTRARPRASACRRSPSRSSRERSSTSSQGESSNAGPPKPANAASHAAYAAATGLTTARALRFATLPCRCPDCVQLEAQFCERDSAFWVKSDPVLADQPVGDERPSIGVPVSRDDHFRAVAQQRVSGKRT